MGLGGSKSKTPKPRGISQAEFNRLSNFSSLETAQGISDFRRHTQSDRRTSIAEIFGQFKSEFPEIQSIIDQGGRGLTDKERADIQNKADTQATLESNKLISQSRESANSRGVLNSGFQTGTERRIGEAAIKDKAEILRDIELANQEIKRQSFENALGIKQAFLLGSGELAGEAANRAFEGRKFELEARLSNLDRIFQLVNARADSASNRSQNRLGGQLLGSLGTRLISGGLSRLGGFGGASAASNLLVPGVSGSALAAPGLVTGGSGVLSSIGSAIGTGLSFFSSKLVKENIRPLAKPIELVKEMAAKRYDYKEGYGQKNTAGLIAEELPEFLTGTVDGIKSVNLYALVSVLIGAVRDLVSKVESLEEREVGYGVL